MKAYTLRLDDELLTKLKYISLEEKRSIKDILLDLIKKRYILKNAYCLTLSIYKFGNIFWKEIILLKTILYSFNHEWVTNLKILII